MLKWLEGYGVNTAIILAAFGCVGALVAISVMDIPTARWLGFFFSTSPLWLPYILFHYFFHIWMEYIQLAYDLKE